MGGTLSVASEEGVGSTFSFVLPLVAHRGLGRSGPDDEVRLEGVRALVVDDNPTNRLILREMLSAWGARVEEAESGTAALRALGAAHEAGAPYEVVLLDGHMPGMDGFEVAEEINRDHTLNASTVLMLTSLDRPGDIAKSRDSGVGAYMVKPIQKRELARALATLRTGVAHGPPPASEVPEMTPSGTVSPARVDRLRVLLAEDVEDNRLLVQLYLKKEPIDLVMAADGVEAVEAFRRTPDFDLVLMDVQMPNVDGLTATRQIREIERGMGRGRTPILALTAHALLEDTERIIEAGCDAHLTKPIRKAGLLDAIAQSVRQTGDATV
jgi:CheY-like chemotaxis protein